MMAVDLKGSMQARSVFSFLLLLALLFTRFTPAALAQSTASLNGTVTDATGAAVPNAKVVATNKATGVESATQTDTAGAYLFPSLPIGIYRIQVRAPGFQSALVANLKLEVATAATQSIQLIVGATTETVEIMADAALVETATTSMSQVINDKTVQEIPLNGRHFTDLSLLTPGTVTPPANGFLSAPAARPGILRHQYRGPARRHHQLAGERNQPERSGANTRSRFSRRLTRSRNTRSTIQRSPRSTEETPERS